jgi:hypothetical protein
MFYNAELEGEIRSECDRLECWTFTKDQDREKYLEMVINETTKKIHLLLETEN